MVTSESVDFSYGCARDAIFGGRCVSRGMAICGRGHGKPDEMRRDNIATNIINISCSDKMDLHVFELFAFTCVFVAYWYVYVLVYCRGRMRFLCYTYVVLLRFPR